MQFRSSYIPLLTGALVAVLMLVFTIHFPAFGDPSTESPGTGFSSLTTDTPGSPKPSSTARTDQPLGQFLEPRQQTMVVVLDPGHGGRDRGVTRQGRTEKDQTLAFARALKRHLDRNFPAIKPVLTRDQDEFLSLKSRTQKANEVGGDLFVSLHVNHSPSPESTGLQLYTLSVRATGSSPRLPQLDRVRSLRYEGYTGEQLEISGWIPRQFRSAFYTPRSRRLAERMIERLRDGGFPLDKPPHREAPLWVLKDVLMPAVTVELGYFGSNGELETVSDPRPLANTLARAIDTFRRESNS